MRRGECYEDALKVCFKNVPVNMILNETLSAQAFPKSHFCQLLLNYLKEYSDSELNALYEWMRERMKICRGDHAEGLNLFSCVIWAASQILIQEDNGIVCRYPELLRWRNLTSVLGENLMTCAYLSAWSVRHGKIWRDFDWAATIPHNNRQLNRVLERGLWENHFHLYGSAPVSHLLWKAFMEHVDRPELNKWLKKIDHMRRSANVHYFSQYEEAGFERDHLRAALIRLWLMARLMDHEDVLDFCGVPEKLIPEILKDAERLFEYRFQIQNGIYLLRDHMFDSVSSMDVHQIRQTDVFAEERWFLYRIFYEYQKKTDEWKRYMDFFYAYLIIKVNFLSEVIQNNSLAGFENFEILQKRKGILHKVPWGTVEMVRQAVLGSIRSGNVHSLEIRIRPQRDWMDDRRELKQLDDLIAGVDAAEDKKEWFFYVYHFIKGKDKVEECPYDQLLHGRHYQRRMDIKKEAAGLIKLREYAPKTAGRVKGIDACSQELGCRPEVFAPVFRRLRAHVCPWQEPRERVPQLRITYHVGEEFLDMIDGLRAIEEAVYFLNLCCGDRLGHATVLGLSVNKWYDEKHGLIHISRQDYLDNVAWFYHKLVEFEIEESERLKDFLQKEFERCFSELYRKNMDDAYIDLLKPEEVFDKKVWRFDIFTYYDAWKLRGDEPELYQNGGYEREAEHMSDGYCLNPNIPEGSYIRERMEVALLYHMYHFNKKVRTEGSREVEIRIPSIYIEGVEKLQKEMQRYISIRGIGIETNPSSNLLISTMHHYHEHPIVNLYNKGLVWDVETLQDCPQLFVSINTDDKGIFYTSLENEYSLMACALEKARDADGRYLYNRQMIYDWLDAIREMGRQQHF